MHFRLLLHSVTALGSWLSFLVASSRCITLAWLNFTLAVPLWYVNVLDPVMTLPCGVIQTLIVPMTRHIIVDGTMPQHFVGLGESSL